LHSSDPTLDQQGTEAERAGVLSTLGICNHDAVEGVDAPAAQEIHDVRPLLRSSRIDEITFAAGLHEHAIALADVDKAYG
jgi:hypothetical protein